MLDEQDIVQFQKLYSARFGTGIDRDTAQRKLGLLVRQMETVYQPITASQFNEYEDENSNGKAQRRITR